MTAWPTDDALIFADIARIWAPAYIVRYEAGLYHAMFRYGDECELEADTPAGLASAMQAHWTRTWAGHDPERSAAPWHAR